jgi:NAD(P)-dependent dehydrogenase (short-subunit alcohol dehydrogenase family)
VNAVSELKGKTLILTGASRGIGRALALQLADAGVNLVLNARDAALLNDVVSDCRNLGMRPIALPGSAADITTAYKLLNAALDLYLANMNRMLRAVPVLLVRVKD